MEENHRPESEKRGKRVSALDSINASFVIIKERAEKENRKLETEGLDTHTSRTLDKINNSYEIARLKAELPEKDEGESRSALLWNLATVILLLVLIAAIAVFIVMIYRGNSSSGGETENIPAVQITETESDSEEPEESSESETESGSEETQDSSDTEAVESERSIPDEYMSILEEEEIEEWKSRNTDNSRLFVQMNQSLSIDSDNKAYLRLINPPYSAFDIQIKIYTQDNPNTVLYQSDILEPGTILEYATFDSVPEVGEYEGIVQYTVYDQDGNTVGTHEVAIEITVQ